MTAPSSTPPTARARTRPWHRWTRRTKVVLSAVAVVVVLGGAVGLALFEPWRLFTRSSLDEAVPAASAVVASSAGEPGAPAPGTADQGAVGSGGGPTVLASGSFVDGEHATTGAVRILALPDGSRYVRLENFSTSDGPDVHVWLTDRPAGSADWGSYDDGRSIALGELKATDGNQNYAIAGDVDLAGLTSVVIWCDRFDVAFGTAAVTL
jgi:hypothetical protein